MKKSTATLTALLAALCILPNARAEIITAGELIVDLRNEDLASATNTWINHATSTNSVGDFMRLSSNDLVVVPALGDTNLVYANALLVNANAGNSVVGTLLTPAVLTDDNSRTVEAWIYPNSVNGSSTPVGWGNSGNANMSSFRYTSNGGNGMFSGWNADVGWGGIPLPIDQWLYVVWTYENGTVNGYINGEPVASGAPGTLNTTTNRLVVGGGRDGVTDAFDGYMGDVRVHTGVLSGDDVANNYAEGMSMPDLTPFVTGLEDVSLFPGQGVDLEPIIAGGLPLYYQWSSNSVAIAGATNSTLSLSNVTVSANGTVYSIVVSNSFGTASDSMTLTVQSAPDIGPVTINLDICTGSSAQYEGTAIAPGAGTQWNHFTGTSSSSYTIDNVVDNLGNELEAASIIITRQSGEVIKSYDQTSAEKGNPNPLDLMSDYLYQGPYTIEITGVPEGAYDLYVYAHGDNADQTSEILVDVTNGAAFGSTTAVGDYRDIYMDGAEYNSYVALTGTVSGLPVFTFVTSGYLNGFQLQNAFPVIQGLTDMEVATGTNLVIDAGVAGRAPFTYQWSYNGSDLPGETGPTLTLNDVQSGDAGEYGLVVVSDIGSATNSFVLTVGGGGPISIDGINVQGDTASITWSSDAGSGFSIESSPSLTAPAWSEVTNVSSVGTQTTDVPVSGTDEEFFRISK